MENDYQTRALYRSPKDFDYCRVYLNQAGGSINPYVSYKHLPSQRGRGFFGRVIKNSIMPLLKSVLPYLKETALDGLGGILGDLKNGESIKEAGKNQFRKTASKVATDVANNMKGSGLKQRRRLRKVKNLLKSSKNRCRINKRKKAIRSKRKRPGRPKNLLFNK